MVFKMTDWIGTEMVEEYATPIEGRRILKIIDADYDMTDVDNPVYKLTLEDIENGAQIRPSYWLKSNENGSLVPNKKSIGTLNSLGRALAGQKIGVPNPPNIIGGVVAADVVLQKKDYVKDGETQTRVFARIYVFFPAPEDAVLDHSEIDQYWEGCEDNTVEHVVPKDGLQ